MTLCQNETVQFELFGWVIEAKWGPGGKLNLWDMGFNPGHRGQLDFQV